MCLDVITKQFIGFGLRHGGEVECVEYTLRLVVTIEQRIVNKYKKCIILANKKNIYETFFTCSERHRTALNLTVQSNTDTHKSHQMTQTIGSGLLSCADKIWDTADTLRGAGIKASEWPAYMMPFFALMMLESRLRRFRQSRIEEFKTVVASDFKIEDPAHLQWLDYAAIAANKGYHRDLLIHEKGLSETCAVPGGNFLNRLLTHLDQYDPATKRLLGINYAQGHAKFLDMQGKAADLSSRDNNPLFPFAQKWASIDLTPFDNSEITTIEEHIKRKWADISAETAGEQYTPTDVIDLASAIIVELRREGPGGTGIADVYDMACGGGNFLFATEDALREAFPGL